MNKMFSGVSAKRMKTGLVVFCLCCGGFSMYLIANAVFSSGHPALKVDKIKILQHINPQEDEAVTSEVDKETYRQIKEYKKYIDSTGQQIRPGLLDSMNVLEQIYLSQQKNDAYEK